MAPAHLVEDDPLLPGPIARHPALSAFLVSFGLGAAFILLRLQGPSWLIGLLGGVFFGLGWMGPLLLIVGFVARRLGYAWSRSATILGAAWTGFPVGFLGVGGVTCAFCLS